MSKKVKDRQVPMTGSNPVFYKDGWGSALLVSENTSPVLVGKLLTIIESWGLPDNQERAIKNVVRNEVYDAFDDAWIVGPEDHSMLREKAFNFGQLSLGGHLPPNYPLLSSSPGPVPSSNPKDRTGSCN